MCIGGGYIEKNRGGKIPEKIIFGLEAYYELSLAYQQKEIG